MAVSTEDVEAASQACIQCIWNAAASQFNILGLFSRIRLASLGGGKPAGFLELWETARTYSEAIEKDLTAARELLESGVLRVIETSVLGDQELIQLGWSKAATYHEAAFRLAGRSQRVFQLWGAENIDWEYPGESEADELIRFLPGECLARCEEIIAGIKKESARACIDINLTPQLDEKVSGDEYQKLADGLSGKLGEEIILAIGMQDGKPLKQDAVAAKLPYSARETSDGSIKGELAKLAKFPWALLVSGSGRGSLGYSLTQTGWKVYEILNAK